MLMSFHPAGFALGQQTEEYGVASAGVPDGTDYDSLRRTFLTLMEHKGIDYIAVARFVGHQVPTMMHAVYSAGASREALLKVADAVRYGAEVERAVAGLSGA